MEPLGKIAYEAYGKSVGWATFSGSPMPTWDEQIDRLKEAWNKAADAVVREVNER